MSAFPDKPVPINSDPGRDIHALYRPGALCRICEAGLKVVYDEQTGSLQGVICPQCDQG